MPDTPPLRCQLIKTQWTYQFKSEGRTFRAVNQHPQSDPNFTLFEIPKTQPVACPQLIANVIIGNFASLTSCRERVEEILRGAP